MALDPTVNFILSTLARQGVKSFEQLSIAGTRAVIDSFPQLQNAPQVVKQVEVLRAGLSATGSEA